MDLTDGELSLESINLYGATDLTSQRRYKGGGEEDLYYWLGKGHDEIILKFK